MTLWPLLVAMGVGTYLMRLSLIALLGRVALPPVVWRALRHVPTAVLSAIILPEVVRPGGVLDLSLHNARLAAGVVAALVAWRTKSVVWTVGAGLAVMWLVQSLVR